MIAAIASLGGFDLIAGFLEDTIVFILVVTLVVAMIGFMVGKLLPGLFGATIAFLYFTMEVDNELLNQFAWIIAIIIIVVASFRIAGFVLGGSD